MSSPNSQSAIPKKSSRGSTPRVSSSAPSSSKHITFAGAGDQDVYSASLVAPVLDESEVLLSSSVTSQNSNVLMRHKEATALGGFGYGTAQQQQRDGGRAGEFSNIESEYVKIQMRNEAKRHKHATT